MHEYNVFNWKTKINSLFDDTLMYIYSESSENEAIETAAVAVILNQQMSVLSQ